MRKKRLVNVLTSAALTAALVMSMGMTAMAADDDVTLSLKKNVTTDGKTYAPDTTFSFNVSVGDAAQSAEIKGESVVVYEGVSGGLSASEIKYSASDGHGETITKDGALTASASVFSAPGIYHYVVSETNGTYEGVEYSTEAYDVYVYVENDFESDGTTIKTNDDGDPVLKVSAIVAVKQNDTDATEIISGKEDSVEFTNNYGGVNPDPEDPENPEIDPGDYIRDVIIKKEVTGNQGDITKGFDFEISITSQNTENSESYYAEKTSQGVTNPTEVTFVSGADAKTISLKNNETIHIYGLSASDTVTVNEKDWNADGYTSSVSTSGVSENFSGASGTVEIISDEAAITYTNKKDITTPTGIILNFAPYILLVAFAGALAVLFLGGKRRDF